MSAKQARAKGTCQICNQQQDDGDLVRADSIRPSMAELIRKEVPAWSDHGFICLNDLDRFRMRYVESLLEADKGELSAIEQDVVKSLQDQDLLTKNLNAEFDSKMTLGQRLADKIAEFGGSWNFILIFMSVLLFWIVLNAFILIKKPFDPYPFILLNLVLSCLAAIQAPVIMMSQNRQESKDRLRAEHDYGVNLKAELEIRNLHEKIDHLLEHQWQRLLEIQQEQMDLMEELLQRSRGSGG